MRAMVLHRVEPSNARDVLSPTDWPDPVPGPGEVVIRLRACGVCHTELDEIRGRLPLDRLPMILGHQAVGSVAAVGPGVEKPACGDRVGVGWIHSACGECSWCRTGRENLCPFFRATGRDVPGGYAERLLAPAAFTVGIPDGLDDHHAAPLLCAGAVGYRALRLTGLVNGQVLGLIGFGASGHLVLQMARGLFPDSPILVFARSGPQQAFARELGADWAGAGNDHPPIQSDAIIDTTPAWTPVLQALDQLRPGGRLVINVIRKEAADQDVLRTLDYPRHLWMEKEIHSVANVTRDDIRGALRLAVDHRLTPSVEILPLLEANAALGRLQAGGLRGAIVLAID